MKSFFKKIALVLTLAMVIGLVPVNTASAAATPGLKYSSKILYVDGDASGKYDDWCWTPSENTKGYDVSYNVKSGSDLVEVAENGKITATGNGVGKAVVEVTYTSQNSGSSKTANFTVYVKQNATKVKLVNATQEALKEALMVGAEVTLKAAKTATDYKKGNYGLDNYTKVITDLIRITSDNEEVVKVEGNKLTAVGGGTANVIVEAYQKEGNVVTATASYPVVVLNEGITSINQVSATELNAFSGVELTEGVKAEDFTIKRNSTNQVIALREVKVDGTDKKKIILTTFESLNDGGEYTLTYGEKDYTFKVTDGKVTNISISPMQIPYQTATEIKAKLLDANGVVLSEYALNDPKQDSKLEFRIETTQGYIDGENKLTLFEKGNTAKATAIYHTYDYDEFGVEKGVINVEVTIVAVDPSAVTLGAYVYTLAPANQVPDFTKAVTTNNKVAVNETNCRVYFYLKNSAGTDVSKDYFLDSSNPDVLLVNNQTELTNGIAADIFATKVVNGAYVLVRDRDGKVVYSLPVAVLGERVTTSITVDTTNVVLSNAVAADDKKEVAVKRLDQYGSEMSALVPNVDVLSAPSTANKDSLVNTMVIADAGKITVNGAGQVAGSYVFRVTVDGKSRLINVTIQQPNESATSVYRLLLSTNSLDTVVNGANDTNKQISIRVGEYKGGVLAGYADMSEVTVKKGNDATDKLSFTAGDKIATVQATQNVSGSAVSKLATGTYTVTVKVNTTTLNGAFVITDSQTPVTVVRQSNSVQNVTGEAVLKAGFKFAYNGVELKFDGDAKIKEWKTSPDNAQLEPSLDGKFVTVFIKSVDLEVRVADGVYVPITVTINQSLIIK